MGVLDRLKLRVGLFGAEPWSENMRKELEKAWGIVATDNYGLSEVIGPGVSGECTEFCGLHISEDHFIPEIIDPKTGEVLPDGEFGELVITTLRKTAAPLIRYRTHDLTRIIPNRCSCGREYPMIDRISGRTDDMIKVKGVNIYPSQIEEVLNYVDGTSSEYQVIIERIDGKDRMTLKVETIKDADKQRVMEEVLQMFKSKIGIRIHCVCVNIGELPRSEKKTRRIFDYRD